MPGCDGLDPRLVELVRLLVRRAAGQWCEKMIEERRAARLQDLLQRTVQPIGVGAGFQAGCRLPRSRVADPTAPG